MTDLKRSWKKKIESFRYDVVDWLRWHTIELLLLIIGLFFILLLK